jgi:hypothetical protein
VSEMMPSLATGACVLPNVQVERLVAGIGLVRRAQACTACSPRPALHYLTVQRKLGAAIDIWVVEFHKSLGPSQVLEPKLLVKAMSVPGYQYPTPQTSQLRVRDDAFH